MLRRLLVIAVVFATAFLLLFLQNKVLVGNQELTAQLKEIEGQSKAFTVVFRDIAGNPIPALRSDVEQVGRKLAKDKGTGPILECKVDYDDANKDILIHGGEKTDVISLRSRILNESFVHPNEARSLFHITRGIDLKGGVEFNCRLRDDNGTVVPANDEVLATLRDRLDQRGLTEPSITKLSNGDIQVVIPGGNKSDAAQTRKVIESTGRLEFYEVLPAYRDSRLDGRNPPRIQHEIFTRLGRPEALIVKTANGKYVPAADKDDLYLGRGEIILPGEPPRGEEPTVFYRLGKSALSGKDIQDAHQSMQDGELGVGIEFNAIGAGKNEEFTSSVKSRGDTQQGTGFIAIAFDGVVKSAPIVREASGKSCVISGRFTPEEITSLRTVLKGGSLSVTPEVLSERVVGATLGEETIRKGLLAMLVSFIAVVLFMQFYYGKRLGTVANLCLVATSILIWSILSVFGATLTLPGLAGLVLTIGMAVDTNILIFERIREELRDQKGMKAAIEAGYDRAFLTIVDAHLTTLITAFILYWIGSGPVKGFGLTLIIGIVVNLFSGVFIGRMFTDWFCAKVESVAMSSWIPELRLPYVEWRRFGYAFSLITAVLGLLWFAFGHHLSKSSFERNFDIDFTGGNMVQVIFAEPLSGAQVDAAVTTAHTADPQGLALVDPAELRKQPYFAEFGAGTTASRQWVFRARDEEGSALEAKRSGLERHRGEVQRKIDALRTTSVDAKAGEADARALEKVELQPLSEQIGKLGDDIANRTEAFKQQLAKAFAGRVGLEGSEIREASWKERSLTLKLVTLAPVEATTATEIADRLKKRTELAEVVVTPAVGSAGIDAVVTFKSTPMVRPAFERSDAAAIRLHDLLKADGVADGDRNAQATLAAELYNDLVNVAAGQKVTIARPFPSSEHFSGQVADQMKWQALLALILALLAILAYVASRFEFRFGIGAVLSLFHDVVLTVGIISFLDVRIDLTVIAALLTIIGYSINDTIVTFDRIRELMRKNGDDGQPPAPMAELINLGIAQTMPRTALTTGTVFITVLVLTLFGGEAVHAFALTLLIGIILGTYSSIFVAAPLLLSFKGRIDDTPKPIDPNAVSADGEAVEPSHA